MIVVSSSSSQQQINNYQKLSSLSAIQTNDNQQNNLTQTVQHKIINQVIISGPTDMQMNQYLKKVFLQTYQSNSYIDTVRINYIKLNNKKHSTNNISINSNHNISNTNTRTHRSIQNNNNSNNKSSILQSLNQSTTTTKHSSSSSINTYLKQLQQDAKKTNLPSQIINNKTLCKLYHKLDLYQNNLISQHQKQQLLKNQNQKTNNNHSSQQNTYQQQNKLSTDKLQWIRTSQQALNILKNKLSSKYYQFDQLKHKIQDTLIQQLQQPHNNNIINNLIIQQLQNTIQQNLHKQTSKLQSLQHKLISIKQQQLNNIQLQGKQQSLTKQIKHLLCQLYRRQHLF